MDRQPLDRLSLRHIMEKHLSKRRHENEITPKENKQQLTKMRQSPTNKDYNKNDEVWLNTEYPQSINRIIHHVHTKMNPQPVDVEAQIASMPPITISLSQTKLKKRTRRKKNQVANSKIMANTNYMSIPEIKAEVQTKAMQNNRRQSVVIAQKRASQIVAQKRMLQEMLFEHQKLQRDRANIASEIQTMKSYLGDIKKRLDTSLQTLNLKSKSVRR